MPGKMHKQLVEAARFPEYLQCFPFCRRHPPTRPPPTHKQALCQMNISKAKRASQIGVHKTAPRSAAHTREK
jgi:hypothetical protein